MSRTERSIVIRRSRADVFALVSDPASDPRWHPAGVEASAACEGPLGVGSSFRLVYADGERRHELRREITHFAPGEHVGFRSWFVEPKGFAPRRLSYILVDFQLEPVGEGTLLTRTVEWRSRGPLAILDRTPRRSPRADAMNDELLRSIKRLLEGRRTGGPESGEVEGRS